MAKKKATPEAPAQAAPVAPTAPAAPAAEAKAPKVPKIAQNGVTRPGVNSTTGKVWAFADSISASIKAPAPRADVMKACAEASINPATAATQYGKWRKFNGLKSEPKAAPVATAAPAAPTA